MQQLQGGARAPLYSPAGPLSPGQANERQDVLRHAQVQPSSIGGLPPELRAPLAPVQHYGLEKNTLCLHSGEVVDMASRLESTVAWCRQVAEQSQQQKERSTGAWEALRAEQERRRAQAQRDEESARRDRAAAEAAERERAAAQQKKAREDEAARTADWECKACSFFNKCTVKECAMCGGPRGAAAPPIRHWACAFCTFAECTYELSGRKGRCSACNRLPAEEGGSAAGGGGPQPQASARGSGGKEWMCNVCQARNPSAAQSCVTCTAFKPGV